jgi:hypothetical protein
LGGLTDEVVPEWRRVLQALNSVERCGHMVLSPWLFFFYFFLHCSYEVSSAANGFLAVVFAVWQLGRYFVSFSLVCSLILVVGLYMLVLFLSALLARTLLGRL